MEDSTGDTLLRTAAFERVRTLGEIHDHLTAQQLGEGFIVNGQRYPLVNPRRGIFKPAQMQFLLSINTVFPKTGNRVWYDDQRDVHRQIFDGDQMVDYAFMGDNPDPQTTVGSERPSRTKSQSSTFSGSHLDAIRPFFQPSSGAGIGHRSAPTLRSAFRDKTTSRRLRRKSNADTLCRPSSNVFIRRPFEKLLLAPTEADRCAVSGFPEFMLLDAAHIVEDQHELLGQPVVRNGIPLSKIHHAAFDAHLIGIDSDFRLHVSERLLVQHDGPMLEAIKGLDGGLLRLPKRTQDYPDRDRLALRFDRFKAAA